MNKTIINLILVLGGAILLGLLADNESVNHMLGEELSWAIGGILVGAVLVFGIIIAISNNRKEIEPSEKEQFLKEIGWEFDDIKMDELRQKLKDKLNEPDNGED